MYAYGDDDLKNVGINIYMYMYKYDLDLHVCINIHKPLFGFTDPIKARKRLNSLQLSTDS